MPNNYLIGIDDGHGYYDATGTMLNPGKRTPPFPDGKVILENEWNKPAALKYEAAMIRCGCRTLQLAPEDYNVGLGVRVRRANQAGCTLVVSWHYDAYNAIFDDKKGGQSVHFQAGAADSARLAACVHKYLIQGTPQVDRGVRPNDLQICRETWMPAILIENGFMDMLYEASKMLDPAFQTEQAEQAAMGTCEFLDIPYIPPVVQQPKAQVIEYQIFINDVPGQKYTDNKVAVLNAQGLYSQAPVGTVIHVYKMLDGQKDTIMLKVTKKLDPIIMPAVSLPLYRQRIQQGQQRHNFKSNLPEA